MVYFMASLFVLLACVFAFEFGQDYSNKHSRFTSIRISVILCCLFIVILLLLVDSEETYKQGQIDALTKKIKYELVTNADSSKTWKEIKP